MKYNVCVNCYPLLPCRWSEDCKETFPTNLKRDQKIKELLPEFNACHVVVGKHEPLQLEEALDSSKLTTIVHPHSSSSKRELTDAYLTIKRADEEISMVAMEMTYTRQHYVHEISAVQNCNQQYSKKKDAFSRGGVPLLHGLITKLCIRVSEIHDLFSVISNSSIYNINASHSWRKWF